MEVYLSHMFIFRVIEKLRLNVVLGNGWVQYVVTVVIVTIGAMGFSLMMRHVFKFFENRITLKLGSVDAK